MKVKIACLLGGLLILFNLSGISWGQAYGDKGLGDAGKVDRWEPIKLPSHLIGVAGRPGIGARIGHYCPGENDEVKCDTVYEAMLSYAVTNTLMTVLGVGYTTPNLIRSDAEEAELTYINLTFELRGAVNPDFALYFGFGPSLILKDYKHLIGDYDADCEGECCGGNLSFGMDYFVLKDLAINIDCKYMACFSDCKCTINNVQRTMVSLDGLVLSAGLKYFFF